MSSGAFLPTERALPVHPSLPLRMMFPLPGAPVSHLPGELLFIPQDPVQACFSVRQEGTEVPGAVPVTFTRILLPFAPFCNSSRLVVMMGKLPPVCK